MGCQKSLKISKE